MPDFRPPTNMGASPIMLFLSTYQTCPRRGIVWPKTKKVLRHSPFRLGRAFPRWAGEEMSSARSRPSRPSSLMNATQPAGSSSDIPPSCGGADATKDQGPTSGGLHILLNKADHVELRRTLSLAAFLSAFFFPRKGGLTCRCVIETKGRRACR